MKCCPYTAHYVKQAGGNHIPVFYGRAGQRGHGDILGSLGRTVMPFLKSAAGYVGKKLLSTGANVIGDVMRGENVGQSLRDQFSATGREVFSDVGDRLRGQSGQGRKRKRASTKKKKKTSAKRRKTSRVETIFG